MGRLAVLDMSRTTRCSRVLHQVSLARRTLHDLFRRLTRRVVATNYPQGGTSYGPAQQYYPHQNYRSEGGITSLPSQSMAPYSRNGMPPGYGPDETAMSRAIGQPVDQRGGMFTRNLIGSLAASAFKLSDTNDRLGIWFILQDLSVRTEGAFR
jgi:hypothetical protein